MSGVIVSVKGRYAVLLTKNSDFIKVKNKNYSVGDKVKIPHYKGQILAAAASFIVAFKNRCKRYECVGKYGRTYKKVGRNRIFE